MLSTWVMERLRTVVLATTGALLLTFLVAYIDYATGMELNVEPLYFLPVSLAAWHAGITSASVIAAVSTAAWQIANEAAGLTFSTPELWLANMATQLVVFAVIGLLIAYLRQRVTSEEWSSRHDELTGLPNTRAFLERAEIELARARRYGGPLTAAYIDLDNFKAINDQCGHRAGDATLRIVATLLQRSARASDMTARIGGDEFVVLMPETDGEGARALLERLRAELESAFADGQVPVSASIGAVSFLELPSSVDELLCAADECMYAAKKAGKNSVRVDVSGVSSMGLSASP